MTLWGWVSLLLRRVSKGAATVTVLTVPVLLGSLGGVALRPREWASTLTVQSQATRPEELRLKWQPPVEVAPLMARRKVRPWVAPVVRLQVVPVARRRRLVQVGQVRLACREGACLTHLRPSYRRARRLLLPLRHQRQHRRPLLLGRRQA
jgi:hypothetical protein